MALAAEGVDPNQRCTDCLACPVRYCCAKVECMKNAERVMVAPLRRAACYGKVRVVRRLLAVPGICADLEDTDGCTALMAAASRGRDQCVEALLACGTVDPNHPDDVRLAACVCVCVCVCVCSVISIALCFRV